MKKDKFFVSVIIPVYNGESFLADAVESIQRQNYKLLEIVIVDDGSTDNTAKIAADFGNNVSYVYQSNSGPAIARNRGLKVSKGNVIAFLDVDDLWSEDKLRLQLGHLSRDESAEIVLGQMQRMHLNGVENGKFHFRNWSEPVMTMHFGCAVFRKSVFDKVGYLDESLYYYEDYDWFTRANEMGISICAHQEVTYFHRRHDYNMTNDTETGINFSVRMLKKSLDRRRKQGNGQVKQLPNLSDFANNSNKENE